MWPDPNAFGRIPRDQEGGPPPDSSKEFPYVGKSYRWKDSSGDYKRGIRQIVGVVDKETYQVRIEEESELMPMGKRVIDKIFSGEDRDREPVSDIPKSKRVEYQSQVDDIYREALYREAMAGPAAMAFRRETNWSSQSSIADLETKVALLEMDLAQAKRLAKTTVEEVPTKGPPTNPRKRKIRFD